MSTIESSFEMSSSSIILRRRMRTSGMSLSITPTQSSPKIIQDECITKRSKSLLLDLSAITTHTNADLDNSINREPNDQLDSIRFDQHSGPSEILPHLYLGSEYHATHPEWLRKNNITYILNVSNRSPYIDENEFDYKHLPVRDSNDSDITFIFEEAFAYINKVRDAGKKILVHCQAGISRSATICIAYLMNEEGRGMDEAMDYIRGMRPFISPNFGFLGQLITFEKSLQLEKASLTDSPTKQNDLSFSEDSDTDSSSTQSTLEWSQLNSPVSQRQSISMSPTSPTYDNESFFTAQSFQMPETITLSPVPTRLIAQSINKNDSKSEKRHTFPHISKPLWLKRASKSVRRFFNSPLQRMAFSISLFHTL